MKLHAHLDACSLALANRWKTAELQHGRLAWQCGWIAVLNLQEQLSSSAEALCWRGSRSRRFTNESRRKASATSGGKQKRCSLCGELGHNKARCPRNPDAKVQEVLEAPKAQVGC